MRMPNHIMALADCGRTFAELTEFRRLLEPFGITVAWNPNKKVWILHKIPKEDGAPQSIRLIVGVEALASMMADYMDVARQFERRIADCIVNYPGAVLAEVNLTA